MSKTSAPRLIIVDDVDSSIQYTGPWYPDQGSRDTVGNFGPSYQSTLHGVNSNASLSFAFNGEQPFFLFLKFINLTMDYDFRNSGHCNWLQ